MQVWHGELLWLATQGHCCLASILDGCLSRGDQPGCFSLRLCCNPAVDRSLLTRTLIVSSIASTCQSMHDTRNTNAAF